MNASTFPNLSIAAQSAASALTGGIPAHLPTQEPRGLHQPNHPTGKLERLTPSIAHNSLSHKVPQHPPPPPAKTRASAQPRPAKPPQCPTRAIPPLRPTGTRDSSPSWRRHNAHQSFSRFACLSRQVRIECNTRS